MSKHGIVGPGTGRPADDPLLVKAKDAWRQLIWKALDDAGAADDPYGRIPAFVGAEEAALRLRALPEWQAATVVKVVPDRAQEPVRRVALEDGKTLYMAVPKLARAQPFYRLRMEELERAGVSSDEAAQNQRALEVGLPVDTTEMEPVDLVVLGSVVVNHEGVRIGKGAGYADLELALLSEAGLLQKHTRIVTTLHELQLVDVELPETGHDYRVDLVVTPSLVVESRGLQEREQPTGVVWGHLSEEKARAIPALQAQSSTWQNRSR
jgi:5-formyltetrahydrofolate cyclo-ligase